jgi:hypothetical protein
MTNATSRPGMGDDGAARPGRGASAGLARWQKVVGVIGLGVVLALAILLLGGEHGPGRHTPSGSQEQPTDVEGGAGGDLSRWNH